jgi:mRNA (guanine-N7-)-methyltransferase
MEDKFVQLSISDLLHCINNNDFKVVTPPHNPVKDEFKKFVNKEISERRKNSSIGSMRTFHNFIKRILIENVVKLYRSHHKGEEICVLDIACGRGGDIFKYQSAGVSHVFAFDKSAESIESINPFNEGAVSRYNSSKGTLSVNIEFAVGDATKPTPDLFQKIGIFMDTHKLINKKNNVFTGFQIMSCQFAMHYFFQSEIALRNVLSMFSRFLRNGGYFIGTCINGAEITKLLEKEKAFKSSILEIELKNYKPRKAFGNEYTFQINDLIDQGNYFNTLGVSTEYLVNMDTLVKIADEYNLKPVYFNLFEQIPGSRNYTSSNGFVSFRDIHELGIFKQAKLKQEEILINNLYTTFVFVKR